MHTVQSWTCELGYGADTMFHKTYFLLLLLLLLLLQAKIATRNFGSLWAIGLPICPALLVPTRLVSHAPAAARAVYSSP